MKNDRADDRVCRVVVEPVVGNGRHFFIGDQNQARVSELS